MICTKTYYSLYVRQFVIKGLIFVCLLLVGAFIAVALWLISPLEEPTEDMNVLSPRHLIAHAGGAVRGHIYTNSKEALMNALDNGFWYIELDLFKAPDGNVVCIHDLSAYRLKPIMTLREAVDIWQKVPFKFVVDKISDPQMLNQYFKTNRAHVYVETFGIGQYKQLKQNGYVPMLSVDDGIRGLFKFVVTSIYCGKVDRIVTYYQTPEYMLRIYKRLGTQIAVYTVNDISYLNNHIGKDVDMVYTDYLIPSDN